MFKPDGRRSAICQHTSRQMNNSHARHAVKTSAGKWPCRNAGCATATTARSVSTSREFVFRARKNKRVVFQADNRSPDRLIMDGGKQWTNLRPLPAKKSRCAVLWMRCTEAEIRSAKVTPVRFAVMVSGKNNRSPDRLA